MEKATSLRSDSERFWSKVDKTSDCWLWTAAITSVGYGAFGYAGRVIGAHRFAYQDAVGDIPVGMQVDHLCHNLDLACLVVAECMHRRCVNPSHLGLATNAENSRRGKCAQVNRERLLSATHCIRGHELTEQNIYRRGNSRTCRECQRIRLTSPAGGTPTRITDDVVRELERLLSLGLSRSKMRNRRSAWGTRRSGDFVTPDG